MKRPIVGLTVCCGSSETDYELFFCSAVTIRYPASFITKGIFFLYSSFVRLKIFLWNIYYRGTQEFLMKLFNNRFCGRKSKCSFKFLEHRVTDLHVLLMYMQDCSSSNDGGHYSSLGNFLKITKHQSLFQSVSVLERFSWNLQEFR